MFLQIVLMAVICFSNQLPDNNTFIDSYTPPRKNKKKSDVMIDSKIKSCASFLDPIECNVFSQVNKVRAKEGLPLLKPSQKCTDLAQKHSEYMVNLSNNGKELVKALNHDHFEKRVAEFQLKKGRVTENVAAGADLFPDKVVKMWLRSSGHKKNIMDKNVKYTGLSAIKDSQGHIFWTQCFSSKN